MTTATEQKKTEGGASTTAKKEAPAENKRQPSRSGGRSGGPRGSRRPRRERTKPEYEQKILGIRRVTRVMAGGRRFSFSVVLVIGNKKGVVGVGVGKANDTSLAIQKAYNNAERNLVQLTLTDNQSIPHEVEAKYSSAQVVLMPNTGRGLVAGSAMRTVLELAGITDVTTRIHSRSKNQLNLARATVKAMGPFAKPFKKEKKVAKATKETNDNAKTRRNDID